MSQNEKWTTKDIPDMQGKTILITGANSGIGYEAASALAVKKAQVVMACRNMEKGQRAMQQIMEEYPQAKVDLMEMDLSSMDQVRAFAADFLAKYPRLHVLINNAGVMATPFRHTADGFELQFGTNHLGHFLLTGLLYERLQGTPNSRVVTVSSYAHHAGRINFDDLQSERSYQKWQAYGQSKLSNLLFAKELQRRSEQAGGNPISIAVHPGYAATNLQHTTWFFSMLNPLVAQSQEMGALPTLYAATSPDVRGGEYIGPNGFLGQRGYPHLARPSKAARDQATAQRLWQVSEELAGVKY